MEALTDRYVRVAKDSYAGYMAGSRLDRRGRVEELRLVQGVPWALVRLGGASYDRYRSGPVLWFALSDLEPAYA